MLKLLDPGKDAKELADLQAKRATLGRMGFAITPILVPLVKGAALSELVNADAEVTFDLDGSGLPRQWGWTTSNAAWLVFDWDGRGRITSARQMFGNVTFWIFWRAGYEALHSLDDDQDGLLRDPSAVLRLARPKAAAMNRRGWPAPRGALCRFRVPPKRIAVGIVVSEWRDFANGESRPTYDRSRPASPKTSDLRQLAFESFTLLPTIVAAATGTGRAPALLLEELRKKILHRFPGAFIGFLIVRGAFRIIAACTPISEAMDSAPIADQLPIRLGLAHFFLESADFSRRNKGIIGAMKGEHLAFDGLGVFGFGRAQCSVKTDDAIEVGAAAGEFQNRGATEAISDGGDMPGIGHFVFPQDSQPGFGAFPQKRTVAFVLGGES
jgi:hypothetical protein